jgi:hypothetical protein
VIPPHLAALWALAWVEGLERRQERLTEPVRIDDTGRPPIVRLRPDRRPRA